MKKLLSALAVAAIPFLVQAQERLDLSGNWQFGFGDTKAYTDSIILPGSMLTNGKGYDVNADTKWTGSLYDLSYYYRDDMQPYREKGNIKFPFFLTPDKTYVGKAYYKRKVRIPREWASRRVVLHMERPHIETTVTVNGKEAGHRMSLSAPHRYDITQLVKPGEENEIEVMIYNGIENVCVGQDSHSVTDQTQGNWNGIVGDIELQSTPADCYVKNIRVYPDVAGRRAEIKVILGGDKDKLKMATTKAVPDNGKPGVETKKYSLHGDTLVFTLDMGNSMQTWDEFSPVVYRLTVGINGHDTETVFGMRDIRIDGRNFYVNSRPTYMRGTVENCCFPLTGYAPTDEKSWADIFAKCKEYGINMMRFHSYCPPEAAFAAADKAGVYLQPEGPSWPNHGVKLNAGMAIDRYLLDESRRIVDAYGNHPSFVMMAAGNEPAGDWVTYCNGWVGEMKNYDPTKVYCGASVGGGWAWDYGSQYHVKGGARGLAWSKKMPGSDDDFFAEIERPRNFKPSPENPVNTHPVLSHEQGQWCAFPDLNETSQYTGPYKARNFEIFGDLLRRNGMSEMAEKFLMASGKLQALCYKYEIERNLRTPDYSGFQLLALNDYSGQGTALEGVLNVFWREKGYVNGDQWRQFCSEIVPLARFSRFVYSNQDTARVPLEVMNASAARLENAVLSYSVVSDDGDIVASGKFDMGEVPIGKNNKAGTVELPLSSFNKPMRLTLKATLGNKAGNSWQFWVYPQENAAEPDKDIYMTDSLDNKALQVLQNGGKVLLAAAGKVTLGSDVVQHYLPVFWNTSWFKMRPPHTTGAYIETSHPLFAHGFPTDNWGNLNWWELLNRAQVMNLLELPADYQSPIQPIDTWHVSRKLGMLVEANVLNGKLLMTTMDISNNLDHRIVARRMRNAIISYMNSHDFKPSLTLEPSVISDFFTKRTEPIKMFTDESPDELKPKLK